MLTYAKLSARPSAFRSLTGMTVEAFDALAAGFAAAWETHRRQRKTTKRTNAPRKRAVGAGQPYALALPDRLLIALVWLRIYPT